MSIENLEPVIEFSDLWLYSKRTATPHTPNNQNNYVSQIKNNALRRLYHKWTNTPNSHTVSDDATSTENRTLISGASGTLLAGQVTVLTGASGSGKSVLLRVLAGLLPMSTGDIILRSPTVSNSDVYHHIHETAYLDWRTQVALLAQHPQLLDGSVLDNLKMPYNLYAHQSQTFDIDWHIDQLAQLGRGAAFLQQNAHYLSGGERQLVNTLRLLQLSPRVLLLDEPTAALDIDTSAQLVSLLMNWLQADRQRTLLWVTHDTKDIMPLANRHWHMQTGVLTEVL